MSTENPRTLFDRARLLALGEAEGLKSRGGRMQCPKRCSEDPRGATVSDGDGGGALWHCQRCGAGGSAVDLIMHTRGLSAGDALRELDGKPLPPPKPVVSRPKIDGGALWAKLAAADPAGEAYLKSRGLEAALPFVRFAVGDTGEKWLDWKARRGYRVAMALRDPAGEVLTFQVRAIRDMGADEETGKPLPSKLSLPGITTTGVSFGDPAAAAAAPVVACAEGIADTLALQVAGAVVVGGSGVDQVAQLRGFLGEPRGRLFVLCPQNLVDEKERLPSEKAFRELAKALELEGGIVRTFRTPEPYKDPAAHLQAVGVEAFKASLERVATLPKAVVNPPAPPPEAAGSATSSPRLPDASSPAATEGAAARNVIPLPEAGPIPLSKSYSSLCRILRTPALYQHLWGDKPLEWNELLGCPVIGRVPVQDEDLSRIRENAELSFKSKANAKRGLAFGLSDIQAAVYQVAHEKAFHPVAEYLSGLKWDGEERLSRANAELLQVEPTDLNQAIIRAWFISAVARALEPGCKVDTVLILKGDQGFQKSEAFRALAGDDFFSDEPITIGEKDTYLTISHCWILEWAELEAFKRARDAEAVKGFVRKRVDQFRPAYGREQKRVPRRSIIVGSTNEPEFLTDATGNRSYWILDVLRLIDLDVVRAWRDQLWAEAVQAYRVCAPGRAPRTDGRPGERWWLQRERDVELREAQARYELSDAWEDGILGYAESRTGLSTATILEEVLGKPPGQWTRADEMRVGRILRRAGFDRRKRRNDLGRAVWLWDLVRPPEPAQSPDAPTPPVGEVPF